MMVNGGWFRRGGLAHKSSYHNALLHLEGYLFCRLKIPTGYNDNKNRYKFAANINLLT